MPNDLETRARECPFCGGEVYIRCDSPSMTYGYPARRPLCSIFCRNCDLHSKYWRDGEDFEDILAKWNARAAPTPPAVAPDVAGIMKRLRRNAKSSSAVKKQMAEEKSLRNSRGECATNYSWHEPDDTIEGRAADTIERLTACVVDLQAALEPFAEAAGDYDYGDGGGPALTDYPDESSLEEVNSVVIGDLRRARAALARTAASMDGEVRDNA